MGRGAGAAARGAGPGVPFELTICRNVSWRWNDRDASGDIRVDTVLAMKSAERKYLFALYVSLGMWL